MPAVAQDPKGMARRPCAECRRLKIRCDREIPCGNCTKRGVSKLCPEGKLTYGSGRFVLAGTTELHDRIQELSIRVQKLESALEAAYAATTADVHPLLRPGARIDISSVEVTNLEEPKNHDTEDDMNISNSFSMLSIDEDVRTSRFTPSHYSLWYLDEKQPDHEGSVSDPHYSVIDRSVQKSLSAFPSELLILTQAPYEKSQAIKEKLKACLPPVEVARALVESYYDVHGCLHNIVPQSLLEEEYWPYGYGCRESDTVCCLSVLYGIFCLGALWAPTPPPGALSPAQYSQLAILAMGQDPLSIIHIEGLILYACYLCGTDDTHGRAWACLGMAIKFAQTLGIDRECRTWKISDKDLQRRRRVFNELHSLDCYLSMLVGRTNYLSKGQHNSPIPQPSATLSPLEKAWSWKYLFLGEGVQALLALVLSTAVQPTYDATLALDKRLRAYNAVLDPKYAKELGTAPILEGDQTSRMRFSQQFTFLAREATLLHLHRSFLNRAIMNCDGDPILGKYSISVMAAYQSACGITRQVRLIKDHQPRFLNWIAWPNATLTAVITLGALIIKTPYSSLAGVAYEELLSGCDVLRSSFHTHSFLLPVLDKLQDAATTAYTNRDSHPLKHKTNVFPLPDVRRPLDEVPGSSHTPPTNDVTNGITPPAGTQEALVSIFGIEDSSIFSTAYPPDPNLGGMNWHFQPPPSVPIAEDPLLSLNGPLNEVEPQLNFGQVDGAAWSDFLTQLSLATGKPTVTV